MPHDHGSVPEFFGPVDLAGEAVALVVVWDGQITIVKRDPDGSIEPHGPLTSAQAYALGTAISRAAVAADGAHHDG